MSNNWATPQTTEQAPVRVVEFTIIAAPHATEQYARPYVMSADSNSMSSLADAVDSSISSGDSIMSHITTDGWLSVSAQPTHGIEIPGGWGIQRGGFRLVLDIVTVLGEYRYEIEGYTEYLDTKSQYIDTNMRLYIDHVVSFMVSSTNAVVDDVNFLHSPVNTPAISNNMALTARVQDVNSSLTLRSDISSDFNKGWADPEADIVDTRPGIYGSHVQVSKPTDLIASQYLKNLVGSWIDNATKNTFDPWGTDSAFNDTASTLVAPPANLIDGVVATGATNPNTTGPENSITLEELMRNLHIDVSQITMVTKPPQDALVSAFAGVQMPLGLVPDWHVGAQHTASWADTDMVTTIAYNIINQLQPVLLRHGLVQAEIAGYIYGSLEDSRDIMVSNIVPATPHINPGIAANALRNYALNNVLVPISRNGAIAIQFSASMVSYGDTRMSITVSNGEHSYGPYAYSIPTYAAAAVSPIVMPDSNTYSGIVNTAGAMQDVVNDVITTSAQQPINTL